MMDGLRPTVTASINGKDQIFLADSGAFFGVISPGPARDLNLKLDNAPYGFQMSGVGGLADVQIATVKKFGIAGTILPNVQFIVGGSEVGTTGVIGQNLLGLADVEYDLPHGAIRLMQTRGCEHTNLAYWVKPNEFYSIIPILEHQFSDGHTIASVTINTTSVQAIFDTGAGGTILSLKAAARAGLTPKMAGAKLGGVEHGFGRADVTTWIVPVKLIRIGDEGIQNARIRIGDIGDVADMLIGADFFISHRIFVSNANHRMFVTYTGGPIFDLTARWQGSGASRKEEASAAGPSNPPAEAAALARKAAVEAAQHDDARALADLGQAITLAPDEPRYLVQRASIFFSKDQAAPAAVDIDKAIKLKPDDVDARMIRAGLRLEAKNKRGAIEDVDAAASATGNADDKRLEMGSIYLDADSFEKAIAQISLWIVNHPVDAKKATALNERCWARGLSGRELPAGLADCNSALRLRPNAAATLDSRGLIYLRLGDQEKALADYDRALALQPRIGWSHYGRSIIERAQGKLDLAEADLATAVSIDPGLRERAERLGIGKQ